MSDIIRKLTSRKFIAAIAGFLLGAGITFTGMDVNIVLSCIGAGISGASALTYIVTEGKIDAESVKKAVSAIQQAAQAIGDSSSSGSILDKPADAKALPEKNE